MDDSYNVPDSTDWLNTPLAGLMPVEQAFRCHVCKDFYNSPMLTSCNHTFCSICIRRCLSVEGKCPLCRANDQESKLRGNWALREAVDAFVKARPAILEIAQTPAAPPPRQSSPKRKADELDASPSQSVQDGKRLRMSTRSSKTRGAQATAAMAREEAALYIEDPIEEEPYQPDDGLVACPICWSRMKPWQVDKHIDKSCPGSPQPPKPQAASSSSSALHFPPSPSRPSTSSSSFRVAPSPSRPSTTNPPERLPALAYSMLKDQALRKKLSELGLSTAGARPLLERRHQEWITLWNANCDSARPKKRAELMQDLDVWERTVGGRAPAMTKASVLGAQIKDKEFDGAAWATRHDDSFRDLIANARRTRAAAVPPGPLKQDTDGEKTGAGSETKGGEDVVDGGDVSAPAPAPLATEEVVDLTSPDLHQQNGTSRAEPGTQHQQHERSNPEQTTQHQQESFTTSQDVTLYAHQGMVSRYPLSVVENEPKTWTDRDLWTGTSPYVTSEGGYVPPVSAHQQATAPVPQPVLDDRNRPPAYEPAGVSGGGGGGGYQPQTLSHEHRPAPPVFADRSRFYPGYEGDRPDGVGMSGGGGYQPPTSSYPDPPTVYGQASGHDAGYRSEPSQDGGYLEGMPGSSCDWQQPWRGP